ncbi:ATP/GTP-binding protein [Peptoniphilus sp. BV3C26]|uniref:AAA family ATPase n=1 Tax=Peptoniphilus sp. BV3C26 TaxID=1111134 RepID=UPI0003B7EB82|nr:AAA family ATPase [Peptoniphilus sp. BV3C26]ERT62237.1 AAA domain protein [Peptoniphilus sp. BV3C26]
MDNLAILNIKFNKVNIFDKIINFDFFTNDKVFDREGTSTISRSVNSNNVISIVGLNAVGKTTLLKIIHFILEIIINNKSLNEIKNLLFFSMDSFSYEVTFYQNNTFHKISSFVERDVDVRNELKIKYKNEYLKSVSKSKIKSKVDLKKFISEELNDNNSDLIRENLDSQLKQILKEDDSIIAIITKDNGVLVRDMINSVNLNFLNVKNSVPVEVLNLFDENIDYLKHENEDIDSNVMLKFKNSNGVFSTGNRLAWGELISSGTIKGNSLADITLDVLKYGGYLLVDEIENHLNKQLVKVFIDLFKDKTINKNGATIVFTTHYPELMDFMNRSDNIYVLRRNKEKKATIELLSDLVERDDLKKSDILLSNYIKGTAPSYENIKHFKDYMKSEVLNVR